MWIGRCCSRVACVDMEGCLWERRWSLTRWNFFNRPSEDTVIIRCQKGGQGSVTGISHITWEREDGQTSVQCVSSFKIWFFYLEIELVCNKWVIAMNLHIPPIPRIILFYLICLLWHYGIHLHKLPEACLLLGLCGPHRRMFFFSNL